MSTKTGQQSVPIRMETKLTEHESFGDWRTIVNKLLSLYHGAIAEIGNHSSSAETLATAIDTAESGCVYRILTDPSVRIAVGRLLTQVRSLTRPSPQSLAILEVAARCLTTRRTPLASTAESPLKLGSDALDPWVWTEPRTGPPNELAPASVFIEAFTKDVSTSVSSQTAVLRSPTRQLHGCLVRGRELLAQLLPLATRSLLAHVHVVCVIDVADQTKWNSDTRDDLCQNVSTHSIPGTIFLSPSPLRNPWSAAEAILHEAAHKKLSDIVMIGHVFRHGFDAADSLTVPAVWNRNLSWNSNLWSADRALFALHYYVHAVLFFRAVQRISIDLIREFGPVPWSDLTMRARSAAMKAYYLRSSIDSIMSTELDEDGMQLVGWLGSFLDNLGIDPGDDPQATLLTERFTRETHEMKSILERVPESLSNVRLQVGTSVRTTFQDCLCRLISSHMAAVSNELSGSSDGAHNEPTFDLRNGYDSDRIPLLGSIKRQVDLLVEIRELYLELLIRKLGDPPNGDFDGSYQVVESLSAQFEFVLRFLRSLSTDRKRQSGSSARVADVIS